jgi:hypothetical protein
METCQGRRPSVEDARAGDRGASVEEVVGGGCRAGDGGASVEEAKPVKEQAEPGPHQGGAPLVEEER